MLADRYRRWFTQECDAHARVLRSLDSVPAERRAAPEFRRAAALVAHLVGARLVWLYRLGAIPHPPAKLFFDDVDPSELPGRIRDMEAHWLAYLARLTDAELARELDYKSWEGQPFRNTVEDVLTQMHTHSPYHRGQIAMLVRAAGGEPAMTDFIFWSRRPGL
jgi:uncharacterized damage-inducible protein DinB